MERAQRGHNEPQTAFEAMHASFEEYEGVLTGDGYLTDAPFGDGEAEPEEDDGLWWPDEARFYDPAEAEYYNQMYVADGLVVPQSEPEPIPVRLEPYVKKPIPTKLRWRVWKRDNYQCVHCLAMEDLTVDHIIPEVKGGPTTPDNLQTLCRSCNSKKGAR